MRLQLKVELILNKELADLSQPHNFLGSYSFLYNFYTKLYIIK